MKLNTNSNIYTFVYMTIVVVIVAVLLAVVSSALQERKDKNVLLDKQKQILGALKVDPKDSDPAEVYMAIMNDTVRLENGKEVYVANLNGATKYVLPLAGKGLWGGIGGYLALNEDKNTVWGVNFNHEGETPGLGAKIVEKEFRSQFENKLIRKDGAIVSVAVLKKGKVCEYGENHYVDAVSGATITSEGVSNMIAEELKNYAQFLNDLPAVEENVEPIEEKEAENVESKD